MQISGVNECVLLWIRIRNFLQDPDPELKVMDPAPELDLNFTKIHKKKLAS
jgi:hypothetical protein